MDIQNKGGVITIFFFFEKLLNFLSKCVDKLKNLLYYINIENERETNNENENYY